MSDTRRPRLAVVLAPVAAFAVGLGGDLAVRAATTSVDVPPVHLGATMLDLLVDAGKDGGTGTGVEVTLTAPLGCTDAGAGLAPPSTLTLDVTVRDPRGAQVRQEVEADRVSGLLDLRVVDLDRVCGLVPADEELQLFPLDQEVLPDGAAYRVRLENVTRRPQRVVSLELDQGSRLTLLQDGAPVSLPLLLDPFGTRELRVEVACPVPRRSELRLTMRHDAGAGTPDPLITLPLPSPEQGPCAS